MKTKFFVILILAVIIPSIVFAQTSSTSSRQADSSVLILSLQKQILQLLTQIQTLQKEVTELKSETGIQSPPLSPISPLSPLSNEEVELPEFTRYLSLGSRGDDVRKLQEFLARDKDIYPEGLTTGFYGPRTVEAVRRWQRKNNVEAVGTVGPKTIAKFRELGQGVVQGLIQQGTPSGMVPPGLMMAPGIQRQMATATPVVMPPIIATTTPVTATTTTPAIPAEPATPATPAVPGVTSAVPATPATPAQPASTSTTVSNELKVTYPNGGETWYKGNSYTITWQNPLANGFTGKEKYYWNVLLKRGNTAWQADGGVPVIQSSYVWSKWTGWAEPIPNAADFKVGISLVDTCAAQVGGTCPSANISITPAGGIDYSDGYFTATVTPPTDTTPPSTPTNLTAVAYISTQVNLSWATSTDNVVVTGYKIYRDSNYIASTASTDYSDQNLTPSTTYTYTVTAYDTAGNVSTQSTPASVTTLTAPATAPSPSPTGSDTTAPVISAIAGTYSYDANITSNSATINWTTDEPADSQLDWGTWTSGFIYQTPRETSLVTNHSVPLTGLYRSTVYSYRINSKDAAGNLATQYNNFRTLPEISNVRASNVTDRSTVITWATSEGLNSDTVFYGLDTNYGTTQSRTISSWIEHSIELSGLTAGTTYHFYVKSQNTNVPKYIATSGDYTFTTLPSTTSTNTATTTAAILDSLGGLIKKLQELLLR